jgi:hypothetical protein
VKRIGNSLQFVGCAIAICVHFLQSLVNRSLRRLKAGRQLLIVSFNNRSFVHVAPNIVGLHGLRIILQHYFAALPFGGATANTVCTISTSISQNVEFMTSGFRLWLLVAVACTLVVLITLLTVHAK